jgi:hypothetical protein
MLENEAEIRTRLCQVSTLMRRTAKERAEIDQKWQALVAERITLQHQLDTFEVYRATGNERGASFHELGQPC